MDLLPVAKAVRDLLATATGKPCGLGGFPLVGSSPAAVPYTILYPLGGAVFTGPPLLDDHADVDWPFQVTSVGQRADQAVWMADRARQALVGRDATGAFLHPLVVPGLSVVARRVDSDGGLDPDGAVPSWAETYIVAVTPGSPS